MNKNISKALPELVEAGIISEETAQQIEQFYAGQKPENTNRLFVIFGILGAVLAGLGLILIIAHNWDQMPKTVKTFFAFLPLILGQVLAGYALLKRSDEKAWTEATSAFLFFAVGACISLISQIYNIPGKTADFILSWMILALPIVYVMKSSLVSLFYIIGISAYTIEMGYWNYRSEAPHIYWLLFSAIIPHYYWLYRKAPGSNFMTFHNWILPLSLIVALGTFTERYAEVMFVGYAGLFGILYQVGQLNFLKTQKRRSNGFLVLGSLGMIILLLIPSFNTYWSGMPYIGDALNTREFYLSILFVLFASALLFYNYKRVKPGIMDYSFLIFTLIFFIASFYTPIGMILVNILLILIGITYIRKGGAEENLGILNYGLLIIIVLVTCRFFDSYFSFVIRGLLFLAAGIVFFVVNYQFIQKTKTQTDEA